jgi:hypothetical protein
MILTIFTAADQRRNLSWADSIQSLISHYKSYTATNPSPPHHQKPGIKLHLPVVLFVKTLVTLPTVALLGVEPGIGRLTIPFPGQVKFGRSSPDTVARTAPASTSSTAPRPCGWRTFNPSGLLVCRCPLQHGNMRLRKEHGRLSETSWRHLNPQIQHRHWTRP